MIFNTWSFAFFGIFVFAVYWTLVPQRFKPQALVASGIAFYLASIPAYLVVIGTLGILTFLTGRAILAATDSRRRRVLLALGIVAIAGTLGYFKYTHLLAITIDQIAAKNIVPVPQIVVPLAISFFTFEFVHVLVDISLGKIDRLDPLEFTTFTFFFPTLVAGPIKRYQSFAAQLHTIVPPDRVELIHHAYRIAIGIFKKVVLADSFAVLVQPLLTPGTPYGRFDYWVAVFAFSGKVYFDFSGYSDVAIGFAGLLGIKIPENFDRPFRAPNIQHFWRRWHISLSTWIRDYLFVPLGGSRRPAPVAMFNLVLAMAIVGLWHGAEWHYVVFGMLHGAALVFQRFWAATVVPRFKLLHVPSRPIAILSVATTFMFVQLSWVLFNATTLGNANTIYRSMFSPP